MRNIIMNKKGKSSRVSSTYVETIRLISKPLLLISYFFIFYRKLFFSFIFFYSYSIFLSQSSFYSLMKLGYIYVISFTFGIVCFVVRKSFMYELKFILLIYNYWFIYLFLIQKNLTNKIFHISRYNINPSNNICWVMQFILALCSSSNYAIPYFVYLKLFLK